MYNNKLFAELTPADMHKLKKAVIPDFVEPMLATLTESYFSSPDWIYEQKLDGERCIAIKKAGVVSLMTRNQKEINSAYPEIVEALRKQKSDNFVIDGEIVALEKGISSFQKLQSRMNIQQRAMIIEKESSVPVCYYIFDSMFADSYDIRKLPLMARKSILKKLLSYQAILQYTEHRSPDGLLYFKQACSSHWEGIIAKRAQSLYLPVRSRDWLKFKCALGQELVIGGYTDPSGSRTDFGALLVGYYEGTKLKYAGKVGTGFSQDTLTLLGEKLRKLDTKTCPFADYEETTRNVHWVKPTLVADFKFAEWTAGGKLRVGRYKGLRDDKPARDVIRERPAK